MGTAHLFRQRARAVAEARRADFASRRQPVAAGKLGEEAPFRGEKRFRKEIVFLESSASEPRPPRSVRVVRRPTTWDDVTTDVSDDESRDEFSLKMCRPWRRYREDSDAELCVMTKRNYKIHAYLGHTGQTLMRHLTVLDTGAGHNFVRMNALTEAAQRAIRPCRLPDIRDANKGKVRTVGTVTLRCQLGSYETRVNFVVCERLSVPVILGCDFCDRYVEAIMPRQKMVELDDGSTVPIIRVPSTRARDAVPLPAPLRYPTAADPPAPKVHASRSYKLQPRSQTWIEVVSKHHGVGVVEPLPLLYERQSMALANGIV